MNSEKQIKKLLESAEGVLGRDIVTDVDIEEIHVILFKVYCYVHPMFSTFVNIKHYMLRTDLISVLLNTIKVLRFKPHTIHRVVTLSLVCGTIRSVKDNLVLLVKDAHHNLVEHVMAYYMRIDQRLNKVRLYLAMCESGVSDELTLRCRESLSLVSGQSVTSISETDQMVKGLSATRSCLPSNQDVITLKVKSEILKYFACSTLMALKPRDLIIDNTRSKASVISELNAIKSTFEDVAPYAEVDTMTHIGWACMETDNTILDILDAVEFELDLQTHRKIHKIIGNVLESTRESTLCE